MRSDDQREDYRERQRKHDRAGSERGRNALRKQVSRVERAGTGRSEDDNEYAQSQRAAQLVSHIDQP